IYTALLRRVLPPLTDPMIRSLTIASKIVVLKMIPCLQKYHFVSDQILKLKCYLSGTSIVSAHQMIPPRKIFLVSFVSFAHHKSLSRAFARFVPPCTRTQVQIEPASA